MTGTEKLRKENQALRKESQDLKNQLKKITDDMLSSLHPYYYFYFIFFVNCKLSLVCLDLNFIFCTHCPASNSLTSCGQCFCNTICLLMKFVVAVVQTNLTEPDVELFMDLTHKVWFVSRKVRRLA